MRNILTLFRREFTAYFTSPVGYVFLIAFALFTNLLGLFIFQPWFAYPEPGLRVYFYTLMGVSTFFVAAVTMRLWADERRGNTFEMLLTLPMRARELVLGKFLAGLAFYAVALALTLTVPFMVARTTAVDGGAWLGALDTGALASAYVGALLAGSVFLAFGLFVSGLCRDQIVAFVLTGPSLFVAYLSGLAPIRALLDSALEFAVPHAGQWIGRAVGVFDHYENMVRGLVDGTDILFFAVWTALFLMLNALSLERRGRAGANATHAVAVVLVFAIGAVANAGLLAHLRLGRVDLTREGVFTVAPVTRAVLSELDDPVMLRYHVSPRDQLPPELQSTERAVIDKLDALREASNGRLDYEVIYRRDFSEDAAAGTDADTGKTLDENLDASKSLERVEPFQWTTYDVGKAGGQLVFSAVEVVYSDHSPEVLLPQVVNQTVAMGGQRVADVASLEYAVVDYVHRASRAKNPVVALVAPRDPDWPPQLVQQHMQFFGRPPPPPDDPYSLLEPVLSRLDGHYDVKRVALAKDSPLPDDADLIVVVSPERLEARAAYELARALAGGTPMVLAVQRQSMDYDRKVNAVRLDDGGIGFRATWTRGLRTVDPGVAALLPKGVSVDGRMLMDRPEHGFAQMLLPEISRSQLTPVGALPPHVALTPVNFTESPARFFADVPSLRWLWGGTLLFDEAALSENGLRVEVLARSNTTAWRRMMTGTRVVDSDFAAPDAQSIRDDLPSDPARPGEILGFPLVALIEGTFPFTFTGRPAWAPKEKSPLDPASADDDVDNAESGPVEPPEAKPSKMLLLANGRLWHREGLDYATPFPPELTLLQNAVAQLTLSGRALEIRELRRRTFASPVTASLSPSQKVFWKTVQVGGHVVAVALAGLVVWMIRSRRRDRYQRACRAEA